MAEATTEQEALDAYSVIVSTVAEKVLPSVASLRIGRGGRGYGGAGSGVVITPDGLLVTSAHVVAAGRPAHPLFIHRTQHHHHLLRAHPPSQPPHPPPPPPHPSSPPHHHPHPPA